MKSIMSRLLTLACIMFFGLLAVPTFAADDGIVKSHGVSRFGDLKYPADFQHFDYANPEAPKGGELRMSSIGDFDSLNPFIARGTPPLGIGVIYDSLMVQAADEPTSMYGLIAESVEYPEDKSWIIFNLRPEARWHDGEPITAEDVAFSFNTLIEKGAPLYRLYYANVEKAEVLGPHRIRFVFDQAGNSELPSIMGQLPVLPEHYWQDREFTAAALDKPLGSGPYKVRSVTPGRSITYERVEDYWGEDLPVNNGRNNFDRIIYEYYRDQTVQFEAFKAGDFDFRREFTSRIWATGYNFPAAKEGHVVKEMLRDDTPKPAQAYVFNTRLEKFSDPRVREALGYAFDFEWLNANLFYDFYTRTDSYWVDSELAAQGLPSEAEKKLLEPYRDQLPEEVFTQDYAPPSTKAPGGLRANLRKAAMLLKEAGWEVRNGKLTNVETGEVMTIEFIDNQADLERVIAPFIRNLQTLGVEMRFRVVDTAQMQKIIETFDFEMTAFTFEQSISPGNEQRDFWGSAAADQQGSRNLIGIRNPVVDALIDKIIFAESRADVVTATHALDRVLLWNHYSILNYYSSGIPVAHWDKFARPEIQPKFGMDLMTWWVDSDKVARLESAGVRNRR